MKKMYLLLTLCLLWGISAFAQNCNDPNQIEVIVELIPDTWAASETNWTLTDLEGNLLSAGTATGDTICVNLATCVYFNIYDNYGDGLIEQGSCQVYFNGEEVASYGNFGSYAHAEFGNCPTGSSCFFPTTFSSNMLGQVQSIPPNNTWYSFVPDSTGIYTINVCNVGNVCMPTIWIYDHCSNLTWDNTQIGSLYVTNGNCDEQAEMNIYLAAATTYYIRVDNILDCMPTTHFWEMSYGGAIVGCMDPVACNYEPLAQINDAESCLYIGDPLCPGGPDLIVVQDALSSSLSVGYMDNNDECSVAEGCVSGYGSRELLNFTTHIKNIGNKDYYIGNVPSSISTPSTQFEWSPCHNHWHYSGYAEYLLYDQNDQKIPAGFKNGFCVMDLECSGGGIGKYGCGEMGITAGCGDIYSAGLPCQWIDITNVPDGFYKLVVRVNWDNSPDKLGYYELNHANNWAQVCFQLSRDDNGTHATLVNDCPAVLDCLGDVYGNATQDCSGVCGGTQLHGDLNQDGLLQNNDVMAYLYDILDNNQPANTCNDLCLDGILDIADAAVLTACILQNANTHTDPVGTPPHSHCNFPTPAVVNPNDTATLSIVNINSTEKYFDIAIKNPSAYILDYQIALSGVSISGAFNQIDDSGYNIDVIFNGNGTVLGISATETPLNRYTTPTVFLRIYYNTITAPQVCLEPIAMINVLYQHVILQVENACFDASLLTGYEQLSNNNPLNVNIAPNPFDKMAFLSFDNPTQMPYQLVIYNIDGKEVARFKQITTEQITLQRNNWAAGMYYYHLIGEHTQVGRFVVNN